MNASVIIRRLSAHEAEAATQRLAEVLSACVHGGASVSFMLPFPPEESEAFWRSVAASVARDERDLFVAEAADRIVGTVQLIRALPPNQPHRAEIAKMLVHPDARRRGIGAALMGAAEQHARGVGRWLLMLDAVPDESGARLYLRLGWQIVGTVPEFALYPDGRTCATTFMYKKLV